MSRSEFTVRAGIIVAAPIAAVASAPWQLVAVLGCLSLANTGQLIARAMPKVDVVVSGLLAVLSIVVLLIVLGLSLNLIPGGLTFTSWQIGWALISAAALLVVRDQLDLHVSMDVGLSLPVALALAILVTSSFGAFAIGNAGVNERKNNPMLEISSTDHSLVTAQVRIQSVNYGGDFVLRALADGKLTAGSTANRVHLPESGRAARDLSVKLPRARGFWKLQLVRTGSSAVERELIIWN
jgi:hypothetical protein